MGVRGGGDRSLAKYTKEKQEIQKMSKCYICPRECGAQRAQGELGYCRAPDGFLVAKTMLHRWEEPCISGKGGAGTVFFSGCNLGCVYCQNREISGGNTGTVMSDNELERKIFSLVEQGAECVEFVTPTHYTARLASLIERIKPRLDVPVVWNSGGYEKSESLRMLDGLVDVYLPDIKYFSPKISQNYSCAPNYLEFALPALREMLRQVGKPKLCSTKEQFSTINSEISSTNPQKEYTNSEISTTNSDNKILRKGVIVRHLVLPSHREDSISLLRLLASEVGTDNILLSLMSQYTPDFYIERESLPDGSPKYSELCRRVTSFEYNSVLKIAEELGFEGYLQAKSSATKAYTPNFSETQDA